MECPCRLKPSSILIRVFIIQATNLSISCMTKNCANPVSYTHLKARQRLSKCETIKLIEGSMIEGSGIYDFDRSNLLFSTVGTSVNGHLLHQILRDRYHIEMEMAAEKYVLGIAAVGDTEEALLVKPVSSLWLFYNHDV